MCLKIVKGTVRDYWKAKTFCVENHAYIVSVKTIPKLEVIKSLANSKKVWVGLDDRAREGTYVWGSDGEVLTHQQIADFFHYPDRFGGDSDCVIKGRYKKLINRVCYSKASVICEKDLPRLEAI